MAMDLNELASFVSVVELGTITAAAEREGVPKSTISRRIARLEETLGISLLRRLNRSVVATPEGRLVYERAVGAMRELDQLESAIHDQSDTVTGSVTVTAAQDFGRAGFMIDLIATFRERYPDVDLEVRLEQRVVDLVAEGVDIAIRPHGGAIPGNGELMSRALMRAEGALFASPGYIAVRGPVESADLTAHDVIMHHAFTRSAQMLHSASGDETQTVLGDSVLVVNDFELARSLAERDLGIAMLPSFAAEEALHAGRLVRVLPEWSGLGGMLSLVWPASRHLATRVRAFVDLAVELANAGEA